MIAEFERQIGLRLSKEDYTKIEVLVNEGKFKGTSDLIRAALKEFLKNI